MKTKGEAEKVEKLRSREVEEFSAEGKRRHKVPVTGGETLVGFSTPQLLDSWTAELREQSENVYENKGQGQFVSETGGSKKPNARHPERSEGSP
jgi:hypothetical protein